ncbi:hypothetical protein GGF41_006768, partial [Coemansia sp. RSA 2531]
QPAKGAQMTAGYVPKWGNPLEERVERCDGIAKDLLSVIDDYWAASKQEQNKPKPALKEKAN